jgi:N-acetyl-alpha-D-glucosaminyl L-malate synthase BshA
MIAAARRQQLDLLHVHYAVPHAASAYLARQVLGATAPRLITTLHGSDVTRNAADPTHREVIRFAVAASDGITVPSDFLRRAAYELLQLDSASAIEVIANFVDTDRFSPPDRQDRSCFDELFAKPTAGPMLFHVSNFRPVKRVVDVIEVLVRVRRRLPARLVLVGDGPERAAAERRARELGVADEVRFLGNCADFDDLLRHADAFLLPSASESFGVAALEALSSGVPVFAYRVGGLPEVVSPEVGSLVEPFDLDALAQAVVEAVSDPQRRAQLAGAARQRAVSGFRRAPAIERYESYYRTVLARPAGQPASGKG